MVEQKMNDMLTSLENKVLAPSIDEDFMAFLDSLTKEVQVDFSQSKNSFSSSSLSGSSIIRMLDSPESPDSVLPGSTCSPSGNSDVEKFSPCALKEDIVISNQNDELSQEQFHQLPQSSSSSDWHISSIQDLPGITTVINDQIQVSSMFYVLIYNFHTL